MNSSISAAHQPRGACRFALWAMLAASSASASAQLAVPETPPPTLQAPASGTAPAGPTGLAGEPVEPAKSATIAAAKALEQARKLYAQGKNDEALATIQAGLAHAPGDVQLRFQRGVIEADSGRIDAAIETFSALAQDFPELPEPHNNLATLYAARGELDLARSALEDAIRALPSYALAHENLGDVRLRLAERAYQRALAADPSSKSAGNKLALVRELIAKISPAGTRPAGTRPARATGAR